MQSKPHTDPPPRLLRCLTRASSPLARGGRRCQLTHPRCRLPAKTLATGVTSGHAQRPRAARVQGRCAACASTSNRRPDNLSDTPPPQHSMAAASSRLVKHSAQSSKPRKARPRAGAFAWDNVRGTEQVDASQLPPSLIPPRYHVFSSSLRAPRGAEVDRPSDWEFDNRTKMWTRREFPKQVPAGRRQAVLLRQWLDKVLDEELAALEAKPAHRRQTELIEHAQRIYSACFHELVRQVLAWHSHYI